MAGSLERDDYIKLCKLRELFHGRFTDEEGAILLEINNGDISAAVLFALTEEPQHVRQRLEEERQKWVKVESAFRKVRAAPAAVVKAARAGEISTSARLFACRGCDKFWWRRTPQRKEVSKCDRCKKKYDPVPRDLEWGWAEFHCQNCGNQFGGWCAMYMTSPCFKCGTRTLPTRIIPPDKSRQRMTRSKHSCDAWDCAGNRHRGARPPPPPGSPEYEHRCVHPVSRRANGLPIVVHPSGDHDSSGSTVNTFLPQDDLTLPMEIFFRPPLPSIPEEPARVS